MREKNQEGGVIWSVVPESIIHEFLRDVLKAFKACEFWVLPDYPEEDGASRVFKKYCSLSISSLLNSFGSWDRFFSCGVVILTCP